MKINDFVKLLSNVDAKELDSVTIESLVLLQLDGSFGAPVDGIKIIDGDTLVLCASKVDYKKKLSGVTVSLFLNWFSNINNYKRYRYIRFEKEGRLYDTVTKASIHVLKDEEFASLDLFIDRKSKLK